jgi:hypothetical protein
MLGFARQRLVADAVKALNVAPLLSSIVRTFLWEGLEI